MAINCYCGLWETSPGTLETQGVPRGFCGKCLVCGKPGHSQAHPTMPAVSGAWCGEHYKQLLHAQPRGALLQKIVLIALLLLPIGFAVFQVMKIFSKFGK